MSGSESDINRAQTHFDSLWRSALPDSIDRYDVNNVREGAGARVLSIGSIVPTCDAFSEFYGLELGDENPAYRICTAESARVNNTSGTLDLCRYLGEDGSCVTRMLIVTELALGSVYGTHLVIGQLALLSVRMSDDAMYHKKLLLALAETANRLQVNGGDRRPIRKTVRTLSKAAGQSVALFSPEIFNDPRLRRT